MNKYGTKCLNCNPCQILSGYGGAGTFSDGKLNYVSKLGKIDLYKYMTSDEANKANCPNYFDMVKVSYYTKTNFTNNIEMFSINQGITKLRIYVWLEGQDVDCENDASVGSISLNLQFSTNPN